MSASVEVTLKRATRFAASDLSIVNITRAECRTILQALTTANAEVARLKGALERIASPHKKEDREGYTHIWSADCDACHRAEIAAQALNPTEGETK